METYKIIRFHENSASKVIKRGLTLEEAHQHCEDPETSSSTCTEQENIQYTEKHGRWFDGFDDDDEV